jgi:hypothetical protein
LQLLGKLACVEIANRTGLNFSRINLRIIDRLLPRLDDDISNRFALFLQVALKIGAPAAENVNFVHSRLLN